MGWDGNRADTSKLDGLVLPLREAPDPHSAPILDMPPTAEGIEATGRVSMYGGRDLWVQVIFQNKEGWVSAFYLKVMRIGVVSRAMKGSE